MERKQSSLGRRKEVASKGGARRVASRATRASATTGANGASARGGSQANDQLVAIYAVVRAIPRGAVATYGQIAELAGIPLGHRVVARAMRSCPQGLPWQRVVGKKDARRACIAIGDPDHAKLQRALLTREGVVFDDNGFIPLRRSGWLPPDASHRRRG